MTLLIYLVLVAAGLLLWQRSGPARAAGAPPMNPRGPDLVELALVGLILALMAFRFG